MKTLIGYVALCLLAGCAVPVTTEDTATTAAPLVVTACPAPPPVSHVARSVYVAPLETVCVLPTDEIPCPFAGGMWKSVVPGAGVPAVCDAQGWRDGVTCPRGTACTVLTVEGMRSGVCAER